MPLSESYCVIVDPYVNTQYILEQFNKHHIKCIGVLSEPISSEFKKVRLPEEVERQFFAVKTLVNNVDELIQYLKKFNLVGVINGSDMGVELADRLGAELKLSNINQPGSSLARRNKYFTNKKIGKQDIPRTKQILLNSQLLNTIHLDDSILNNLIYEAGTNIGFPLVLKPTQSRGTFGVKICYDHQSLRSAIKSAFGSVDVYGQPVSDLIIEEILIGREYAVDTVSLNGKYYIAGMYVYNKEIINGSPIYRDMTLIDSFSEEAEVIREYIYKVLAAVEFNFGPAHIEVFLTTSGSKLVEINPRVSGAYGFANRLCKALTGRDQIEMLVDSYVDPDKFNNKYSGNYIKSGYGKVIMLQNFETGILSHYPGLKRVQSLSSFRDIKLPIQPGQMIKKTIDFCTCPGVVLMSNDSQEQLNRDFEELLMIEKTGLFCINEVI